MYVDLEAELHDLFWDEEDTLSELPFLEKFYADKVSLEIGCGSGRLMIPFLTREIPVPLDGIEISSTMTAIFEDSLAKLQLKKTPAIYTADILEFTPEKTYERVSIPSFTAQLLSRDSFKVLLQKLQSITSDDGQIYLTTFIPWAEIAGELPEQDWYPDHETTLGDGTKASCKTKFTINRLEQQLTRQHQYKLGKRQHRCKQELQWYCYPELELLLQTNGWKVASLITDLDSASIAKPSSDAHLLTIIAEKIERT